ncbi:MAG TPA: NAD-dependent epimerase/dehydratase family protein [Desulfobacterales bacterium]|nr:NAD-dependent epimerase/dehydratase family protein [Desulfobacterales bacterium]HIP39774.1 NAD-dependent epimerase/dehydratase family protein [Desulfocapsa sulfexigens]
MIQRNSSSTKLVGVLIGGSGLIGGTLAYYFKTKTPDDIELRAPSSKKLSIRNTSDIIDYLKRIRPDFVINTAIANISSDSQLAFEVNYIGTLNLARATAALKIPYIHISSAATLPNGENLTEEDSLPIQPQLNNYAKSKLMAEVTLKHMHKTVGLDYTCIRLAVVYGEHDHKIQGFHRLFFSIADESMPVLFTKKNIMHSYSNANKFPYFVHHVLLNRDEFKGETYHFVDKDPVELANLILTIRSYLELKSPREIYVPYSVAMFGKKTLEILLKGMSRIGIHGGLPAELMFLESFYKTQTLSAEKLLRSSFVDPNPEETIFTKLPELVIYYLKRWTHENLISTFNESILHPNAMSNDFEQSPAALLNTVHDDSTTPFTELIDS